MERQIATKNKAERINSSSLSLGILQRKCACGNQAAGGGECGECGKNKQFLQRRAASKNEPTEVSPIVYEVFNSPGQPVNPETRAFMEPHFSHGFSQVRVHTEEALGTAPSARLTEGDEQQSVTQSSSPQQASGGISEPSLVSGSLLITEQPLTVTQQGGNVLAVSRSFNIAKPFTVSASVDIKQPTNVQQFTYGIVQNVLFDHVEEVFTDGDILLDSVGPMVDVDPTNTNEVPFIHGNNELPTQLFTKFFAHPHFTDVPSLDVKLKKTHCQKGVDLVSVERSIAFRSGLVARNLLTNKLVPLGATQTTYASKWHVDFNDATYQWSELISPKGNYPLSASAIPVETSGVIAGIEGQNALNNEVSAFEKRCYNVL